MFRYRRIGGTVTLLLIVLLIAACGGATSPAQVQKPTPTPSPTPGQGTQLLANMAQKINTATTLHGVFDVKITGQSLNGSVNSEIWNATPNKNRTVVLQSTLTQFPTGSVSVTNGKQTWQYDPAKKVVYTGTVTPSSGADSTSTGGQSQFILNIVQTVFTHSDATLTSSTATINGHAAYDVHVEPQGQMPSSGGMGNVDYVGDVYIDKTTNLPLRVNLSLQGFGQVQLDLPTLVLNQSIPASTFTFVVPAGVKVLPLQQTSPTADTGSITLAQAQQQAGYHLLSIPSTQTDYQLITVNALGTPGSQIYTLSYAKGSTNITIAEGKPLANLPASGSQQVSVRGTTGTVATSNASTILSWTEHGVGINITAPLSSGQLLN
ncbi:MAG: LolA family protein, partial [Ktedonobacteraceae bacterium]